MKYIKPELVFKKFYSESFLADTDIVSTGDNDSGYEDPDHGIIDFNSSGADGWMNG